MNQVISLQETAKDCSPLFLPNHLGSMARSGTESNNGNVLKVLETFTKVSNIIEVKEENSGSECYPRDIYAKFASPSINPDTNFQNIPTFVPPNFAYISPENISHSSFPSDPHSKARAERAERYRLLSVARSLLIDEGKKDSSLKYAQNFHLTAKCLVTRFKKNVDVCINKQNRAYYAGLIHCGSVWSCPVCAFKIQEQRRFEICQAMQWAYAQKDDFGEQKYQCLMVTLTFPHYAFDTCRELVDKQAKALRYFRSGKRWDNFKKKIGFIGLIRALEVTHGENGFHPHTHEIWIVDKNCGNIDEFVLERWAMACKKVGLLPDNRTEAFDKHAIDIKYNASTSDYLAKQNKGTWGADKELAMPGRKAEKHGKAPFDLLAEYANGDIVAGRLFVEYSIAFKGRKQLWWSVGLKELVGLPDITNEQVAKQEDKADILASLEPKQWDLIIERKARSVILDIAEVEGKAGIQRWFAENGKEVLWLAGSE